MTTEPPTPTPFQRLTEFARRVIAVPKAEVDEQAKKYRRRRREKRKMLGNGVGEPKVQ